MDTFGSQLRALRLARGWTAIRLADEMGERPQSVSNWERDKSLPATVAKIERLEQLLDVPDRRLIRAAGMVAGVDELAEIRDQVKDHERRLSQLEHAARVISGMESVEAGLRDIVAASVESEDPGVPVRRRRRRAAG